MKTILEQLDEAEKAALEFPVKNSEPAIIDAEDLEKVAQYSWRKRGPYVVTTRKNRRALLLHRLIMGDVGKMVIDHINGNPLDNRKANLRVVKHQQNSWNARKRSFTLFPYKGVCKGRGDSITIQTQTAGERRTVHGFKNQVIGALIYDLITVHRDEHTELNFDRDEVLRFEDWIQKEFYPNIRALIDVARAADSVNLFSVWNSDSTVQLADALDVLKDALAKLNQPDKDCPTD